MDMKLWLASSGKPVITSGCGFWRRIFCVKSPEEILEEIIKNNRKKLFMSDFYFKGGKKHAFVAL